jgi:methionine-rich copper-binding protein CopC
MSPQTTLRLITAIVLAGALGAVPAVALAHVELVSSDPEPGSNLETPPDEVTLTFDGELDPDGSSFTVEDHHGEVVGEGVVDLDVADRNVMAGTVSISEPGVYTVEWTVLGADGHENPDTALPAAGPGTTTLAGLLLVVLAALATVRRVLVR